MEGGLEEGATRAQVGGEAAFSFAKIRRQLYALLAWSTDYQPLFEAERDANSDMVTELASVHISAYSKQLIRKGGAAGQRVAEAAARRLADAAGFLDRARNVHTVPISQENRRVWP